MALKGYLGVVLVGTVLCWIAWALVLWYLDPFVSGFIGFMSFYCTLFLALLGTFSLLGFLFRRAFVRNTIAYHHISISVRQGFFLATVVVGTLLMRGMHLYTWWSIIFLIAGFTVLELFFLQRQAS